jgi:hypothetical protein
LIQKCGIQLELDDIITNQEIQRTIMMLKNKKSPGQDGILNKMIKGCMPHCLHIINSLFNQILKSGQFPNIWKVGLSVPIYKNGNPNDPGNFRGITLNSCVAKLFCQVINTRINNFLENNNKLTQCQAGFRKNARTSDQVFIFKHLIDVTTKQRNGRLYACFIDYKKAFDSVWHNGLLVKLFNIGVQGRCFSIIRDMYTNSKIKTKDSSQEIFIKRGVHQGNTLSPTLFNIFINDIV